MMLCPSFKSRRWTRRQKVMQEKAMAEARAAGWRAYQQEGDESSVEGEFDLENEEHTASNSWSRNRSHSCDCPTDEEGSNSGVAFLQFSPASSTTVHEPAPTGCSSPPKKSPPISFLDKGILETSTTDEAQIPTPRKSNSKTAKPVKFEVKSFSSMKMFTPDYFEKQEGEARVRTTPMTAQTANTSFSDDDDDSEEEESQTDSTTGHDDTALENKEQLEQILHHLQAQHLSPPVSTAYSSSSPYAPYHASPHRGYSDFSPRLSPHVEGTSDDDLDEALDSRINLGLDAAANHDASMVEPVERQAAVSVALSEDVTESTAEVTLTETAEHNISDNTGLTETNVSNTESVPTVDVIPAVTVETIPDSHGSTKDDDVQSHASSSSTSSSPTDEKCGDEGDDDDSLDMGVSMSVWPSQHQSHTSSISTLSRGIFSPRDLLASAAADETDGAESMDDDDDASLTLPPLNTHEGANVFLATEGARYGKLPDPASYIEPISTKSNNGAEHNNDIDLEHLGNNNLIQMFQEAPGPDNNHRRGNSEPTFVFDPADVDVGDDLDFQPRYHDDPEEDNTGEHTCEHRTQLTELINKVDKAENYNEATPAKSTNVGGSCFGDMMFVSPMLFEKGEDKTETTNTDKAAVVAEKATTLPSLTSPLASMVHPMDLRLFELSNMASAEKFSPVMDDESVDNDSVASCPVMRSPTTVFLSDRESFFARTDVKNRRSHLSSSFKSSTRSNRVAYRLNAGKKSMSKTDQIYSKALLPSKAVLSPADIPKSNATEAARPRKMHDGTLSILLVEMSQKIFEIVSVDTQRDTTVGDVLAKARAAATDPALSEQKYVSISYGDQEFGAPMLPVALLIDWEKHKTRPLVVAVPMGHSASEMQAVKRVLSKHPKIQRWWKKEDPFRPMPKEAKEGKMKTVPGTPAAVETHVGKPISKEEEATKDEDKFVIVESFSV